MGSTRHGVLALADRPHDRAFDDRTPACDRDRAELEQRHGVAVRGLNRQRAAASRDRAGERDGAGDGRADFGADGSSDVDSAMLAGRVLVIRERERPQNRSIGRPGPGGRGRNDDKGCDRNDREGEHALHGAPPS